MDLVVGMQLQIIKKNQGFSLMELLVVIAIIAIILSISMPKLNRANQGAKLKTTVEVIKSMLDTAKTVARSEHLNCEVRYDSGENKLTLYKDDIEDQDSDGDTTDMIEFKKGYKLTSGINLYFTADNKVTFNAYSQVENSDDNIIVSAPSLNKQKTIQINATTGYIDIV